MPKKWNLFQPECTLAKIGIQLGVTKLLQNNLKLLLMIFFSLGVDQDIINEYHHKLVQLQHEYGVYQVHEMCMSIDESKQHNQILTQPVPSGECSFRNIFRTDLDLMITQMEIDLGEDFSTGKLIKQNIDVGQWIFVLDGGDIQSLIIHT
jgi:hypothetical protein